MNRLSDHTLHAGPWLQVTIEVPRGGFAKRDSRGRIVFVSPLPCPFNYGSVPGLSAGDADWRDAVVLGPRFERGVRIQVPVRGIIAFVDDGREDFKLICSSAPLSVWDRKLVCGFFAFYAACKRLLNRLGDRCGPTASLGWCTWSGANPMSHKETPP